MAAEVVFLLAFGFTDCISALMSTLYCKNLFFCEGEKALIFSRGTKRVTLTFQGDGGRWERLSYECCANITPLSLPPGSRKVFGNPSSSPECDVCVQREAAMQSLAGQTWRIGNLSTGEGGGSNVEVVLHLLCPARPVQWLFMCPHL